MTDIRDALEGLVDAVKYGHTSELTAAMKAARDALAAEPEPPDAGEVAELVEWLHGQDGGIARRAIYSRIADLLSRLAKPVPVGPSDEELVQLAFREKLGRLDSNGNIITRYYYPMDIGENVIDFARAVLDRWGTSNLAQVRSSLGEPPGNNILEDNA